MKTVKEYWWLLVPLSALAVYLYSIKDRLFENAEQRIEMVKEYNESPTAEQKQKAFLLDSLNDVHAVQIRQKRYEDNKRKDSFRLIDDMKRQKNDSLFLDQVKRQTVQIEQMKKQIKNNNE